ncbi:MAG: anti-sigma F factor antagonist [Clostridiales bacterium]|jgi:stage II sporulation protein AA (anti-sigma F factor antagonist)|nr:anti-sigma F factor antagonist [Clostridiales bacterium]
MNLDIKCTERNGNLVVKIMGEIDHHSADEIRHVAEREFFKSGAKNMIFDFAHVGFMDSSGIGMIIGRYKELKKVDGRVFAINIGPEVGRIFDISGLKKIIPCYSSIDEVSTADRAGF